MTPEQNLWKSVVVQAIMDALPLSGFSRDQYYQQKAWSWFYRNSADYKEVCWNAGIDPQKLRQTLLEKVYDPKGLLLILSEKEKSLWNYKIKTALLQSVFRQRILVGSCAAAN